MDAGPNTNQVTGVTIGVPKAVAEGRFVVPYVRYNGTLGAHRAYTRTVTYAADGTSCTDDDECASTNCARNVCGRVSSDAGAESDAAADAPLTDADSDASADGGDDGNVVVDAAPDANPWDADSVEAATLSDANDVEASSAPDDAGMLVDGAPEPLADGAPSTESEPGSIAEPSAPPGDGCSCTLVRGGGTSARR